VKEIGAKLAEAIVNGLRWLANALTDPVGEVHELVNDPEIPMIQKILGVSTVIAIFIVAILMWRSGHIPLPLINAIGTSYVAAASRSSAIQSGDGVEVPRDD